MNRRAPDGSETNAVARGPADPQRLVFTPSPLPQTTDNNNAMPPPKDAPAANDDDDDAKEIMASDIPREIVPQPTSSSPSSSSQEMILPTAAMKSAAASEDSMRMILDDDEDTEIPHGAGGDVKPRVPPASLQWVRTDRVDDQEVDFYRNPTILSRLILHQKYESALKRLCKVPEEAQIWVCQKRKLASQRNSPTEDIPYTIRQLPIHAAAWNLDRYSNRSQEALNLLIVQLVIYFPQGCRAVDHSGRLPLHFCIAHGAHPETVSCLLMAYPEALDTVDRSGRTLTQLNQMRGASASRNNSGGEDQSAAVQVQLQHQAEIQKYIDMGLEHWKQVHSQLASILTPAAATPEEDDDDDAATTEEMAHGNRSSTFVEPIAWEQLEERALALEELLTQINERNFTLTVRLRETIQAKEELRQQLDHLHDEELVLELGDLREQNDKLKATVLRMEYLIRHSVLQMESPQHQQPQFSEGKKRRRREGALDEPEGSPTSEGHSSNHTTITNKRGLVDKLQVLHRDYESLMVKYDSRLDHIRRLETVIDTLTGDVASRPSPVNNASICSDLTSTDHHRLSTSMSARYDLRNSSSMRRKKDEPPPRVPPHIVTPETDDLSVLFRKAATQESAVLAYRAAQVESALAWVMPAEQYGGGSGGGRGGGYDDSRGARSDGDNDDESSYRRRISEDESQSGVRSTYSDSVHGTLSRNSSMYESIISGGFDGGLDENEIEIPALDRTPTGMGDSSVKGGHVEYDRYTALVKHLQEAASPEWFPHNNNNSSSNSGGDRRPSWNRQDSSLSSVSSFQRRRRRRDSSNKETSTTNTTSLHESIVSGGFGLGNDYFDDTEQQDFEVPVLNTSGNTAYASVGQISVGQMMFDDNDDDRVGNSRENESPESS